MMAGGAINLDEPRSRLRSRNVLRMPMGLDNGDWPSTTVPLLPHPHRQSASGVWRVVSSSSRDHPRGRVCCLPSSVRNISQLIEIASRAVQPLLDGSRCRFSCCLASLSGFLAIVPRRQGWRVLGFIHEPQDSRGAADRGLCRPLGQRNVAKDAFLTRTGAVG